ncbi:54S ribosomal protein L12, mitochondrial [Xanthoria calcicola]
MSVSIACTTRCCARVLRTSPRPLFAPQSTICPYQRRTPPSRRHESTSAAPTNPKIATIVDQISQLTLLETADLVSNLKSKLNIPDLPMGGFASGPAAAAAPPPAAEEEEAAPAAQEKTLFTLTLKSFDAAAKPKIIKEIKSMLGLSLVESKKFVEGAPKMMKEGVPKEEGEKIVETMKGLGGVVGMD